MDGNVRIGLIGAGEMGSGIGGLLAANGATVVTTLRGRSRNSAARIARAGIGVADDLRAVATTCGLVLSIVPPDQALGVAREFATAYEVRSPAPLFVDCNAVAPETVRAVGATVAAAGLRFLDAGIIGSAPRAGYDGPRVYASGPDTHEFVALSAFGLQVRVVDATIGSASALKMCYAGITKGITAVAAAMQAAAASSGMTAALNAEFAESQPMLHAWFERQIPTMYPKAYRWVGEMREIATFGRDEAGVAAIYEGFAQQYASIAESVKTKGPV